MGFKTFVYISGIPKKCEHGDCDRQPTRFRRYIVIPECEDKCGVDADIYFCDEHDSLFIPQDGFQWIKIQDV